MEKNTTAETEHVSILGELRRPGRHADHSSPSIAEIKNGGIISPLPNMLSWFND
jgi:hypothetical protein